MKSILSLLFFAFFSIHINYSQTPINLTTLKEENLNGSIKTLYHSDINYNTLSNGNVFKQNITVEIKFNQNNLPQELKRFEKNGKLAGFKKFEYNKNGNIISESSFNNDSTIYSEIKYSYNSQNKQTEKHTYDKEGELKNMIKQNYDDTGNNIEIISYDKKMEVERKTVYKYDKDNRLVEHLNYNKFGKSILKRLLTYNVNGLFAEEKRFLQGNYKNKVLFTYNDNSDLIKKKYYSNTGDLKDNYTYEYNSNRQKTTFSELDVNNKTIIQRVYNYDTRGNLIEVIYRNSDNIITGKRTLKYDDFGNWVEIIEYSDNKVKNKRSRKFQYY